MRYVFDGECLFDEKGNDVTDEFYGSYHPGYDAVKSIDEIKKAFISAGFMTKDDELVERRSDIVWVLRNRDDEPVGLYYPSNPITKTFAIVEFITDYIGVPHKQLADIIGDPEIKTVRTMTNPGWLDTVIETGIRGSRLLDFITPIPTADSIISHYTADDVCRIMRVERRTIDNWIRKGRLNPTQRGNKLLFPKREVDKLK